MILELQKGAHQRLAGVSQGDLDCPCGECLFTYVDSDILTLIDVIIQKCGPIQITSGFRCTKHNQSIGGKPGSYHLTGKAVDFKACNKTPAEVADLFAFHQGGLGVYSDFVHMDVRGYQARWTG